MDQLVSLCVRLSCQVIHCFGFFVASLGGIATSSASYYDLRLVTELSNILEQDMLVQFHFLENSFILLHDFAVEMPSLFPVRIPLLPFQLFPWMRGRYNVFAIN